LVTGDPEDLEINLEGKTNIIWALHKTDIPKSKDTFAQHSKRGSTIVTFAKTSTCYHDTQRDFTFTHLFDSRGSFFDERKFKASLEDKFNIDQNRIVIEDMVVNDPPCPGCKMINLTLENFSIPLKDHHVCKNFSIPQELHEDHHLIRFRVTTDNPLFLHHVAVYKGHNCGNKNIQIFNWVQGKPQMEFPEDVGVELPDIISFQCHFSNPSKEKGKVANIVLTLYIAPKRQKEGGMLSFEATCATKLPKKKIKTATWHVSSRIVNFDSHFLGTDTIYVFLLKNHMHERGRKQWVDHYSNNRSFIQQIGVELNYDHHFQGFIPQYYALRAGDNFIIHCIYDITKGDTSDEMCFVDFYYYPKVEEHRSIPSACFTGCECDYNSTCLKSTECNAQDWNTKS